MTCHAARTEARGDKCKTKGRAPATAIAERALDLIPSGEGVSATNTLGAHLSARRRVLSFPFLEDAKWVAADETQPGYADRYAPVPTAVQLAALRRNPEWHLVFEEDGILVFRRAPT